MANYLSLIEIGDIITAKNKEAIVKFLQEQTEPIEIMRGCYSFLETDSGAGDGGEMLRSTVGKVKPELVTILSSLLHTKLESRIVIYITAKNRTTAEKFLGYFAEKRLSKEEVEAELNDPARFPQIAAALQLKPEQLEYEIL